MKYSVRTTRKICANSAMNGIFSIAYTGQVIGNREMPAGAISLCAGRAQARINAMNMIALVM
jgi:hypothetical protein